MRSAGTRPTIAVLVIGNNDEELAQFCVKSPSAETDPRFVYVRNGGAGDEHLLYRPRLLAK
jgi:hypothetical protein